MFLHVSVIREKEEGLHPAGRGLHLGEGGLHGGVCIQGIRRSTSRGSGVCIGWGGVRGLHPGGGGLYQGRLGRRPCRNWESERYASYWNAFLLYLIVTCPHVIKITMQSSSGNWWLVRLPYWFKASFSLKILGNFTTQDVKDNFTWSEIQPTQNQIEYKLRKLGVDRGGGRGSGNGMQNEKTMRNEMTDFAYYTRWFISRTLRNESPKWFFCTFCESISFKISHTCQCIIYSTVTQWRIQDFLQGGVPTPKIAIIFQIFAENYMKMKEFGPRGRVPGAPLDPPMHQ